MDRQARSLPECAYSSHTHIGLISFFPRPPDRFPVATTECRSASSPNIGGKLSSGPFTRLRSKKGAAMEISGFGSYFG